MEGTGLQGTEHKETAQCGWGVGMSLSMRPRPGNERVDKCSSPQKETRNGPGAEMAG